MINAILKNENIIAACQNGFLENRFLPKNADFIPSEITSLVDEGN